VEKCAEAVEKRTDVVEKREVTTGTAEKRNATAEKRVESSQDEESQTESASELALQSVQHAVVVKAPKVHGLKTSSGNGTDYGFDEYDEFEGSGDDEDEDDMENEDDDDGMMEYEEDDEETKISAAATSSVAPSSEKLSTTERPSTSEKTSTTEKPSTTETFAVESVNADLSEGKREIFLLCKTLTRNNVKHLHLCGRFQRKQMCSKLRTAKWNE